MKALTQLIATTATGFALGSALMFRDQELMVTAGAICSVLFFITYSILFVVHAIYKRLARNVDGDDNDCSTSLLGFDSQGTLKIESDLIQR